MSTPTMRMLVPKNLITPLKRLGKYDWLKWKQEASDPPSTSVKLCLPDAPELFDLPDMIQKIEAIGGIESVSLFSLFAISKSLAFGPKVLQPTAEQCEALKHVDVNVSHADYEQPFPAIIVEFPAEFRDAMTTTFEWRCPRFVVLYHDKRSRYLFATCIDDHRAATVNIMSPRPQFATIEESLRFDCDPDGNDLRQGEVLHRIACNFGLLLTRFGAKDCGPFDAEAQKKQVSRSRSSNPKKAQRAQALLDASMNRIVFDQEVVFFETVHSAPRNADDSGAKKRTHWRRGHFRRQRCGAGRTERRLVFVRPCLINAAQFQGDLADTEYRIHSHGDATFVEGNIQSSKASAQPVRSDQRSS